MVSVHVTGKGEGRHGSVTTKVDAHHQFKEGDLQLVVLVKDLAVIKQIRQIVFGKVPEDKTGRKHPQPADEPVIEHAFITALITLDHFRRQT